MQLEQIEEIIEFTDTDHLSQAMEVFNEQGLVSQELLPFLNVVFDKAPEKLCHKLSRIGFKGQPAIISTSSACDSAVTQFFIFNASVLSVSDVLNQIEKPTVK
ncbi:hypothetical protein [Vibrio mediterranei]|uniref:Uncharacterized protein n=1 Tax=Vibrio mediterranei TaxID=689 RepID=A0AAN1FK03_9VIBR|nr:hypothetical protein [Vibrio mediterranei]ASI92013.1 hypothetical protein BSZ05_19495 [Vibrio mediterranei]